jgi:hypothetical protein
MRRGRAKIALYGRPQRINFSITHHKTASAQVSCRSRLPRYKQLQSSKSLHLAPLPVQRRSACFVHFLHGVA